MKRKLDPLTRVRLELNLDHLESYCRPEFIKSWDDFEKVCLVALTLRGVGPHELNKLGDWPSRELLKEIEDDVLVLAQCEHERVKRIFPVWKAFERVDKSAKRLRLKSRVNDLIRRAQRLLPDESVLAKAVTEAKAGNAQARCSLGDMVMKTEKLAELLQADRQMMIRRCLAVPLVCWAIGLGHPMAKNFGSLAEFIQTPEEYKTEEQRTKNRERVRRHRSRLKKSRLKSVTPWA
jgi:hypothetical protein